MKTFGLWCAAAVLSGVCVAGQSDETTFWQARIDATAARGGGRVTVPAGRHLVAGLFLRDNIELHLEEGAVLEGLVGLEHYPVLSMPHSEGTWSAIVMATNAVNVAITGKGEIFGNGTAWPQPDRSGGLQEGLRARGLFFSDTRNIRLEDFFLRDAACWGVVFKCCDGVVARRVRIDNHANYNNDGFDIEAANALFEDCDVDASDDAFVLKSNDPSFAVTNVVVRNSIARSHCNALKLGTASHGTMADVVFRNVKCLPPTRDYICTVPSYKQFGKPFWSMDRGAEYADFTGGCGISALCVECVDGGRVENVLYEDIGVEGYRVPIFIRGGTRSGRATGTPPGDQYILRNVTMRNVKGVAASPIASSVSGVDGCRVRDVTLEDVEIVCRGADAEASRKALTTPIRDCARSYPEATMFRHILPGYGLYADRVDGLALNRVRLALSPGSSDVRPPTHLTKEVSGVKVRSCGTTDADKGVRISTRAEGWRWKTKKGDLDCLVEDGHVQGFCCDETGVYLSYAGGITKFDWQARKLVETRGPTHLGDSFAYKGKVYAAFALRAPEVVDGRTMRGMIAVYDATTLKLEKSRLFDEPLDGCCVINDVIYSSPDRWGKNGGNNAHALIRRFDLELNDLGITELDFGFSMHYGVQTMATDGTNLYCCCYGKQKNTAVLTPDLKLLGTCRFRGSEGFCWVPESVVGKSTRPYFAVVHACGGNMQGWRADPIGNPPQIALKLVPLSAILEPSQSK